MSRLSAELGLGDGHPPLEVALQVAETPVKPLGFGCPRQLVASSAAQGAGEPVG